MIKFIPTLLAYAMKHVTKSPSKNLTMISAKYLKIRESIKITVQQIGLILFILLNVMDLEDGRNNIVSDKNHKFYLNGNMVKNVKKIKTVDF